MPSDGVLLYDSNTHSQALDLGTSWSGWSSRSKPETNLDQAKIDVDYAKPERGPDGPTGPMSLEGEGVLYCCMKQR